MASDLGGVARLHPRVAGVSTIVFAVAGLAWFVLETTPPRLGFEDTDNPALMVQFVREHPDIPIFTGLVLLAMALSLLLAVLAVADVDGSRSDRLAIGSVATLGLFAAAFYLVAGAFRIGASGPLLHFAGLDETWGNAAYVVAQAAGQALLISGIVALCLWAVGLSLIGARARDLPMWLCALGAFPAIRLLTGILGPLGLLPSGELFWLVSMVSIPGTLIWCLALGFVLVRGTPATAAARLDPATGGAT